MRKVLLEVAWASGRVVRVSLRGLPLVRSRSRSRLEETQQVRHLNREDITSLSALHQFLTTVTRAAEDGTTVDVVAFDPDVDALLDLLEVEGPTAAVIMVTLPPP